jgi:hypothetical protein
LHSLTDYLISYLIGYLVGYFVISFMGIITVCFTNTFLDDFFRSYFTLYFGYFTSFIYLNFWLLLDWVIDFSKSLGLLETIIESFLVFIPFSFFYSVFFYSSDYSMILLNILEFGEFSYWRSSPDKSNSSYSVAFFISFTFVYFIFGFAKSTIICFISSLCKY